MGIARLLFWSGLVFCVALFAILIYQYSLIMRLVPVNGEVTSTGALYGKWVKQKTYAPPSWQLKVEYVYEYAGVRREGFRLRMDGNFMSEETALRQAEVMGPLPKPVTVWVDPENPEFAVLEPKLGFGFLTFVGVWCAVTLIAYLFAYGRFRPNVN